MRARCSADEAAWLDRIRQRKRGYNAGSMSVVLSSTPPETVAPTLSVTRHN